MIPLLFTVLCSTSIALLFKQNDVKNGNELVLLSANYFMASIIAAVYFVWQSRSSIDLDILLFGAILGILFLFTFFIFAKAVQLAGTALATVSSRLSVIIPIGFSIIFYKEIPTTNILFGFAFTVLTLIFFYISIKSNGKPNRSDLIKYLILVALLLGIGINDFAMKVFKNWKGEDDEPLFILSIFLSAFLFSFLSILFQRQKPKRKDIQRGLVLGIPNVFSTYFLLWALAELPAIIVYPSTNIGIIILTAIFAYLIWKEKLNKYGILALSSGIVALAFLTV